MEIDKEISTKLNVMIGLLHDIKDSLRKESTVKEKVAYFVMKGMENKDIAKILGISLKHVSKEKTLLKKK